MERPINTEEEIREAGEFLIEFIKLATEEKDFARQEELALKLVNDFSRCSKISFLVFWVAFSRSNELLVDRIIKEVQIIFNNQIITQDNMFSFSVADWNNYALTIATEFNMKDELLGLIIGQGKMSIEADWILRLMVEKRLPLVKAILVADSKLYYTNEIFKQNVINLLNEGETGEEIQMQQKFTGRRTKNLTSKKFLQKLKVVNYEKQIEKFSFKILLLFCNHLKNPVGFLDESYAPAKRTKLLSLAVALFDEEKQHSKEIIDTLFKLNSSEIALQLLESNLLSDDPIIFKLAVFSYNFKFALYFFELHKESTVFLTSTVHSNIIEQIPFLLPYLSFTLYTVRKVSKHLNMSSTKLLIKSIQEIIENVLTFKEFIEIDTNPIKTLALIAEILQKIATKYPTLEISILNLRDKTLNHAKCIQEKIDEDSLLREIMLDKDLDYRSVLDVIQENNFLVLLENQYLEKVIDDIWNGPYFINNNFYETSSAYKTLCKPLFTNDYEFYANEQQDLGDYVDEKFQANFTNFKVWRKHVTSRYVTELACTVMLLSMIQVLSILFWFSYRKLVSTVKFEELEEYENNIKSFEASFTNDYQLFITKGLTNQINNSAILTILSVLQEKWKQLDEFSTNMNTIFTYLQLLSLIFFVNPFFYANLIALYIKKKKILWHYKIVIDMTLTLIALYFHLYSDRFVSYSIASNYEKKATESNTNWSIPLFFDRARYVLSDTNFRLDFYFLDILLTFGWLRILILMTITNTFGPTLLILLLSIKGIFLYFAFFISLVFILTVLGALIFFNLDKFFTANLLNFFMFIFTLSIGGNNSIEIFYAEETWDKTFLLPFIATPYLLITHLVLVLIFFNLIIAHMSNIYSKYRINSIQMVQLEKLSYYKQNSLDDMRFDGMTMLVYPIGAFILPFSILSCFSKNHTWTSWMNRISTHIVYSQFFVIYFLAFVIGNVFFLPFLYVKVIITKFYQLFVNDIQEYIIVYKVISLVFFIIFGLLFIVYNLIIDIICFLRQVRRKTVPLLIENEEHGSFYVPKKILFGISTLCNVFNGESKQMKSIQVLQLINEYLEGATQGEIYDMSYQDPSMLICDKHKLHTLSIEIRNKLERKGFDFNSLEDFVCNLVDTEENFDFDKMGKMLEVEK